MGQNGVALDAGKILARSVPRSRAEGASAIHNADLTEDTALVRRALAGDQEAFATIVEKYKDPVFNVAYRMLGNPTEAEDVAQETFVRAYTQLRTYQEGRRFSTWLLSIASHLSIDQLRRRRFLASRWRTRPSSNGSPTWAPGPSRPRSSSKRLMRCRKC